MTTTRRREERGSSELRSLDASSKAASDVESGASLIFVVGVLAFIGAVVTLLTAPAQVMQGENAHAVTSALHGLVAGLFMIASTISLYQAYRLYEGKIAAVGEVQIATAVTAALSALTIVFGNWIYAALRTSGPPRGYYASMSPVVQKIFFEFKEHMALFTLPLAVVAAYIAYYYGRELLDNPRLRILLGVIVALVFFYFFVAFGLGAAITKLKPPA